MIVNDETKIVTVEILDQALIAHYGTTMRIGIHNAIVGQQKGKWRIIEEGKPAAGMIYETKVMEPKRPDALTLGDVGGDVPKTKGLKKKVIAWIQDQSRIGGAELSNAEVIRIGTDCGFKILLGTPANSPDELAKILDAADVIILNNLFEFPLSAMRLILEAIFSQQTPYIKVEHDHREIARPEFSRRIFQNSVLNVFLSPVHMENHKKALGCDGIAIPLAIDPKPFMVGRNDQRQPGTALVSNTRHFKSWVKLQKYVSEHPDILFTLLAASPVVSGENVQTLPMATFDRMPETYARFEYVVHLLDGWGAGERVIFEGVLAGCKVVSDERAGHMSWGRDLTDREGLAAWLTQAPFDFWKEVEKVGG